MNTLAPPAPAPPNLPLIRQELVLLPAPNGPDGSKQWFLHDPVRHAFHTVGQAVVDLLSVWRAAPAADVLAALRAKDPDTDMTADGVETVTGFLFENKLTIDPPQNDPESFARQEAATRTPIHEMMVHKYLFFKIPLWQPERFLRAAAPYLKPFFYPATWITIGVIGLIGIIFAVRQWDSFVTTFMHFFTLEGFIFYALTLAVIKALHELGHGFAAHHYGARVPVIGLAFLVMFPILYTDTTDAWRLRERRERLFIDAAGMMVELAIACLAIAAWSFLPDGPARSAAFFAATTSWAMSLLVNLNPFMRFDGYYLIGDFCRIQNMQKRGFEWGRWLMRETLFGLGEAAPLGLSPRAKVGLAAYAYATWVYRFFLFIGIAILVHHIFPKAIGIVLFTIEILFFIVRPILAEMKVWGGYRMKILSTSRGRITLTVAAGLTALFFTPWQTTLRAPALLQPADSLIAYAPAPAKITDIHVKNGDHVTKGQALISLSAPHLAHDREQALQRLALIDAQLDRMAANLTERRFGATLIDARAKEVDTLTGIDRLERQLILRAPYDGVISELGKDIHTERFVTGTDALLRIVSTAPGEIIVMPKDYKVARLSQGAQVKFVADDPNLARLHGRLNAIPPTSVHAITDPVLTSVGGGSVAVTENEKGELIPTTQVFRASANIDSSPGHASLRQYRGVAHIQASASSPARALRRRVMGVLIRETDF